MVLSQLENGFGVLLLLLGLLCCKGLDSGPMLRLKLSKSVLVCFIPLLLRLQRGRLQSVFSRL